MANERQVKQQTMLRSIVTTDLNARNRAFLAPKICTVEARVWMTNGSTNQREQGNGLDNHVVGIVYIAIDLDTRVRVTRTKLGLSQVTLGQILDERAKVHAHITTPSHSCCAARAAHPRWSVPALCPAYRSLRWVE